MSYKLHDNVGNLLPTFGDTPPQTQRVASAAGAEAIDATERGLFTIIVSKATSKLRVWNNS